ncbi:hypothetical protein CYLTODRAFT_452183 [Cylindrobasidium torrendii FP15055 ss-10]|uniref:Uncharacterized protein n=1 Tax=Cylindrobasidium torrendii FP15055 ss-10 TaxID=1314674 RepID=A0A0D7BJZ5_9AGAR|nr:hypothetical protein CYLTODRAFT_452183 [Cylindrobasidium torrendii FP15055 ss-10]
MSASSSLAVPPVRRQSYTPPSPAASLRRPLRSSPLAGPSLNITSDGQITQLAPITTQPGPRPSRISSTPNLTTLKSFSTISDQRWLSSPNVALPARATLPSPPPSPGLSRRPKSRESPIDMTSFNHNPQFPRAYYTESQSLPTSPSASSANLHDSSWLTANPYDSTPKFSRLSMGKDVVMPVSAKDRRRQSTPAPSATPITITTPFATRAKSMENTSADPSPKLQKRKSMISILSKKASFSSPPPLPSQNAPSVRSSTSSARSDSVTSLESVLETDEEGTPVPKRRKSMGSVLSMSSLSSPSNIPPLPTSGRSIRSIRSVTDSFTSHSRRTSSSASSSEYYGVVAGIQEEFSSFTAREAMRCDSPVEESALGHGVGSADVADCEVVEAAPTPISRPKRVSSLFSRARTTSLSSIHSIKIALTKDKSEIPPVPNLKLADPCETEGDITDLADDESSWRSHHKKGSSFLSFASSEADIADADLEDPTVTLKAVIARRVPPPIEVPISRRPMAPPPPPILPPPCPPTGVTVDHDNTISAPLWAPQQVPELNSNSGLQTPTTPTSSRRRTLTPSSPASSIFLLTPTNPIAPVPTTGKGMDSIAEAHLALLSPDSDSREPVSLMPTPSVKWAPSTLGPRTKAMAMLGMNDFPNAGSDITLPATTDALHASPPPRSNATSSVRKFFRALTGKK